MTNLIKEKAIKQADEIMNTSFKDSSLTLIRSLLEKHFEDEECKKGQTYVFDKPIVITQMFEVSIPGTMGRYKVLRKQVMRQSHNTACDSADTRVEHEVTQEIHPHIWEEVVQHVEKQIRVERDKKEYGYHVYKKDDIWDDKDESKNKD